MRSEPRNITDQFQQLYVPRKALLMYEHLQNEQEIYIESFDCNTQGKLINAHPLSEQEITGLANILRYQRKDERAYLYCRGLLPANLLYANPTTGYAIWHTPKQMAQLYFTKSISLPDGKMNIPALIWKANKHELYLFAHYTETLTESTPLFAAPFYNIYEDQRVCMGTVDINFEDCDNIEAFISGWQTYFFNSKFSHVIGTHRAAGQPLKKLYRRLLNNPLPFPDNELFSIDETLKDIIP